MRRDGSHYRYLMNLNNGSHFLKNWPRNHLQPLHLTASGGGRNGGCSFSTADR
jgi:hypothetical protein